MKNQKRKVHLSVMITVEYDPSTTNHEAAMDHALDAMDRSLTNHNERYRDQHSELKANLDHAVYESPDPRKK